MVFSHAVVPRLLLYAGEQPRERNHQSAIAKLHNPAVLSIEQLRKIDPMLSHLSDDKLLEIRNSFYDLGQLIFDDWLENGAGSKSPVGVLQRLKDGNKIE